MQPLKRRVEEFHENIPENLERFSDVYFHWSRESTGNAGMNPRVTKHIHAGLEEDEEVDGLEETAELYDEMTGDSVDIFLSDVDVEGRKPLMMVEGPLQELFIPETVVLGSLSYHLTEVNEGYDHVTPEEYGEGVQNVVEILEDLSQEIDQRIGFADFGARHYHPVQQEELAKAAYDNGAVGHSTPAGAEAINEEFDAGLDPSGTMNHAFVIPHAAEYGEEDATLKAFKNYHSFFQEEMPDAPTPVLIDTFNSEITDTLEVCEWLEDCEGPDFDLTVRIDTNGANYAEGVDHETGRKGVSVEAVKAWNEAMIEEGYRDNINFLISSGKGYVDEMEEWADECVEFHEETGYSLFDGVGAGSFDTTNNLYTTSDIVRVEGEPVGKEGRLEELQNAVDEDLENYMEENMVEYTADAAKGGA